MVVGLEVVPAMAVDLEVATAVVRRPAASGVRQAGRAGHPVVTVVAVATIAKRRGNAATTIARRRSATWATTATIGRRGSMRRRDPCLR
jgi:hypothetical protein